jgi:hypothetical protein
VNIASPQLLVWGHNIMVGGGREHDEELLVKHSLVSCIWNYMESISHQRTSVMNDMVMSLFDAV